MIILTGTIADSILIIEVIKNAGVILDFITQISTDFSKYQISLKC